MKKLLLVFVAVAFSSCSFDNKTGIWKDASDIVVDNRTIDTISDNLPDTRYENIFSQTQTFNEEKEAVNFANIKISDPLKIANWFEQYAIPTNNISNFSYNDNKKLLSKSRKLSKSSKSKKFVFYKNNLVSHDHNGKIFIYSLNSKKKIFEYDFYKKNFKNFNKKLSFVVNENTLYVADNLGYLYALDVDDKSVIWAKNYGISFRSNLKFINDQIFLANQDNVIYSINSQTGDKNWEFATSVTFLKSDFENNFALDIISNSVFFLNTSGELYSINYLTQKINWVLNFKNSSLNGDTELFLGQPIVIKDNTLVITTGKSLLSYDILTGVRNWNFIAETSIKPIITRDYTYIILKNNLLVCLDNKKSEVIWSKNIFANIESSRIRKKFGSIIDFKIVNSLINIYSNNGYLLTFNLTSGKLLSPDRISKNGISSEIIFINDNMLLFDEDNRLLNFN